MNTKTILFAAALVASASPALAGGFLTNTNHGASFLRMPAQEGYISIEGAYYNPAGIGFLNNGWHFAFNNQSAFQTRTVESTFPAFAYGLQNGGQMTKRYKGTAVAPILPAVDLGYVSDRWFGSFHFGVVGGGGKCEFKDGLGSFESVVSVVPSALNGMTQAMLGTTDPMVGNGYGLNTYMRGKQFFLGAQIGVGYKILPELSVSLGGRLVYATSNYYGYVKDIQLTTPAGQPVGVTDVLAGMATQSAAHFPDDPTLPARIGYLGQMIGQVEVNCDQKGWGFAPIIGVDYKKGPLTIGARYEFKTRLRLKNQSATTAEQARLLSNVAEFVDGVKVANDIPALLGIGAGYEFTPKLRANIAAHYYFDKQAHQFENKQKLLDHNTWELLAGVEYDINKQWTVSAGGQTTNYGLGKEKKYISDLSFTTSSYSLGCGVKFKVSEKVGINLAYFKTFYYSSRKTQEDYNGLARTLQGITTAAATPVEQGGLGFPISDEARQQLIGGISNQVQAGVFRGSDLMDRTNDVIGIGVDIHF